MSVSRRYARKGPPVPSPALSLNRKSVPWSSAPAVVRPWPTRPRPGREPEERRRRACACEQIWFLLDPIQCLRVAAVPLFIIFNWLGLLDSVWAPIIGYAGFNLPFAVWVGMSFLRRVPRAVLGAARLDGLSWFQTLTWVALPMSISG